MTSPSSFRRDREPLVRTRSNSNSSLGSHSTRASIRQAGAVAGILGRLLDPLRRLAIGGRLSLHDLVQMVCMLVAFAVILNVLGSASPVMVAPAASTKKMGQDGSPTLASVVTSAPTSNPSDRPTLSPIPLKNHHSNAKNKTVTAASASLNWITLEKTHIPENSWTRPKSLPNDHNFPSKWCNLKDNTVDWYPKGDKAWQADFPRVMMPGPKYGGAQKLAASLHLQDVQAPRRRGAFFLDRNFRYVNYKEQTNVYQARAALHAAHFYQKSSSSFAVDHTSGYFFYSSLAPRRILCALPWIQLVFVLRNPTDRVLEQFAQQQNRGLNVDVDEFIDRDFKLLEKAGLLKENKPLLDGSKEQDVAWLDYQDFSVTGILGRSMYAISLRQWCLALKAAGRSPSESILIVSSDDWNAESRQVKYQAVKSFVGLESTSDSLSVPDVLNKPPRVAVSGALRGRLDDFFDPYNKKLAEVISHYDLKVV